MLWKHPAPKISYKAKLTRNVSLCVCILYLYLYFVFVFVFETNLNHICSYAYQRVHKISHKAKIEKKSFVDLYIDRVSCLRLSVFVFAKPLQPLSENAKNSRSALFSLFVAFSVCFHKFATRQFHHHPG